jgi:hypothetical protein
MSRSIHLCAWAILLLGSAAAQGATQNVTALHDDPLSLYELKSDYFVQSERLAGSQIALPLAVLEESGKGYVKVQLQDRQVWLDSMDVEVHPPKGIGSSGCIISGNDNSMKAARGAGESCR